MAPAILLSTHLTSLYTHPVMLLLFFLVHILYRNGSAAPVALPLAPRSSADSCDDINNCRKLFDIVWGCLATIFACTWVSVHPNVPPPNQSRLALFGRKLKMMLIATASPEIIVGFAARQFVGARMLSKDYGLSRTHGFFFCMGGFVSSAGYPVVTKKQLKDRTLGPEFLKAIRNVDAEDIRDKSKGDALSKGVALAQGLWFTTQCLARVHQHLVVTELEVATLAFAVVNIFIWLLWWDKPLDVQRPMVVGPPKSLDMRPIIPLRVPRSDRFSDSILGYTEGNYHPVSSNSVPSFWSLPIDKDVLRGTVGITALAGSVFGAIHCAAWNTNFPIAAEMWIWRSCSLVIAAIPVVLFLVSIVGANIDDTILGFAFVGFLLIYVVARSILISLPLTALWSLPSSALADVNWSTYIPHI